MINILATNLSVSNIHNVLSQGISTKKIIKGKRMTVNREVLGDISISNASSTTLKLKFIEKIHIGKVNNGKYCIAFGYNPALGDPNKIDNSNGYLIGLFETKYEGYFLINLYPDVSPHIQKGIPKTDISAELRNSLICYANPKPKTNDIYLFAGSHFDLMNLHFYYNALKLYNVFILTDVKNSFKHIAALKHKAVIHQLI